MPMQTGEFGIVFREPVALFLDNPLSFFVQRFNFGEIEFKLAPHKQKGIVERLTFDPAAKNDAYALTITLDGDQLEKSSFKVAQIKNAKFVKLLRDHGSKNNGRAPLTGATPLISIFSSSYNFTTQELKEIVPFLVRAGADLNAQDAGGSTALGAVAKSDRRDLLGITQRLLKAGANPNIPDANGDLPLLLALRKNNRDIAKLLINSGAELNVPNNDGALPLNLAVIKKDMDLAKLLIQKGANVNAKSGSGGRIGGGMTALHFAVQDGQIEMVKLLIDSGARVTERDNHGRTPIGLAGLLIEAGHDLEKMRIIFKLLKDALEKSQKHYVQEWKEKSGTRP